ncbi:MAG: FHA domain-containing protein, partial [Gemmatimonadales bacterium]
MKAQFKVLTGAKAGHTEVFSKPFLSVGRHPASDLKLDPQQDLDVSARHCAVLLQDDRWYVRDLGSKNGTLVNGHTIARDTKLDDTDQIQLGPNGPKLEFRLVSGDTPDGVLQAAAAPAEPVAAAPAAAGTARTPGATDTAGGPAHGSPTGPPPEKVSTTQRIRIEVGRQTKKLRTVTISLFALLLVVAGVFFWQTRRQEQQRERELAAAQARTDSILAADDEAMRALRGQVEGLANALQSSQQEVSRLQGELNAAQRSGDAGRIATVQQQLSNATQALEYQQMAARVDYRSIVENNQRAVAMVWVRFPNGEVQTGTAFAVRPDAVMLTNRHVVAGPNGTRRPQDIAIRFADSDQTWQGRLLATSETADLAVIQAVARS